MIRRLDCGGKWLLALLACAAENCLTDKLYVESDDDFQEKIQAKHSGLYFIRMKNHKCEELVVVQIMLWQKAYLVWFYSLIFPKITIWTMTQAQLKVDSLQLDTW